MTRRAGCDVHTSRTGGIRRRSAGADGFSLIEVLIAALVLVVGLVAMFGLLDTTVKATAATRAREGATNVARQLLEDAHTIPFAQMSPTSIDAELQAMPRLADASSAAGWQVIRRGVTYTVALGECSIDDPKDGYGVHQNAGGENPFCTDSAKTGTADSQPEDLKRISVDVTWAAIGRSPDVHQVETLTAAGVSPGLAASNLHLESPVVTPNNEPTISEEPVSKTLVFAVTAPSSTTAMRWSLEGAAQSTAPVKSSETTWSFSWAIPYPEVSDGTYTVTVQAIDATGVLGPPVSIPVTLIRGVPAAPKSFKGGFNTVEVGGTPTKVVELEWSPNTERNVIGYRVFDPSNALVCPESAETLSVAVSCIDGTGVVKAPDPASANLQFSAVALYRNAKGEIAQGPAALTTVEGGTPSAPDPPTSLTATKEADGSVALRWTLPSGGPPIKFFRIYRGSTDYTSRYAATESGTSTSFRDESASTPHSYWVTAVGANLTESAFVGPVTE